MKAQEFVTDVDDVEIEDWCVTNTHAHFWYCADVSKSPLLKIAIENALKNHQMLTYLRVCLIKSMTFENISLLDTTKSNVLNSFHLLLQLKRIPPEEAELSSSESRSLTSLLSIPRLLSLSLPTFPSDLPVSASLLLLPLLLSPTLPCLAFDAAVAFVVVGAFGHYGFIFVDSAIAIVIIANFSI